RPAREYLDRSRAVLRGRIIRTCDEVSRTLSIYDDAYARLTQEGRPTAFRDFLLDAPSMFAKLGDQLGAVQHIVSYWRFRFGPAAHPANVEELMDIFMDFETGLLGRGESPDDIGMMAA
ncbi:MAG: hypothetical protein KKD06_10390, partial [Alphaproteobacteria bacterium]|nr:hypothetical protein [Alphaproteobacteria bacterium]